MRTSKQNQDDRLQKPEELAAAMGTSKRVILEAVKRGRIPVCRINDRVLRFHLPTVMEALTHGGSR